MSTSTGFEGHDDNARQDQVSRLPDELQSQDPADGALMAARMAEHQERTCWVVAPLEHPHERTDARVDANLSSGEAGVSVAALWETIAPLKAHEDDVDRVVACTALVARALVTLVDLGTRVQSDQALNLLMTLALPRRVSDPRAKRAWAALHHECARLRGARARARASGLR